MKNNAPAPGCDTCDNCDHFDGSKHANDVRTQHAGICNRWSMVTWKKDSCNQFINSASLPDWDMVIATIPHTPQIKQLNLFDK